MSKSLKIKLLLTFFCHSVGILRGQNGYQNLVVNPSFEQRIVLTLTNFPKLQILVKGHTSSEGNAEHNQRLSERRAEAVKNYLVQKGIAAERLATQGFGATQPISVETTEENRRLNRRIEFDVKF